MTAPILVTGATGNVGSHVVRQLLDAGRPVRAAARTRGPARDHAAAPAPGAPTATEVTFDFTDPATWPGAFEGVETMLLVRPPVLDRVRRDLLPAVAAAQRHGVRSVVFLSIQGADANRVVPHHAVESGLRGSALSWTFIRASYFMQNLSTQHVTDIRDRDQILVPAGDGATAFVDTVDVAAVSTAALLDPQAHAGRAWTPTGPEALTYDEVAAILSDVLGRRIDYPRPGFLRYLRHARTQLGMTRKLALISGIIYLTARAGRAGSLTDDVQAVTGRPPIPFREFAERERARWQR